MARGFPMRPRRKDTTSSTSSKMAVEPTKARITLKPGSKLRPQFKVSLNPVLTKISPATIFHSDYRPGKGGKPRLVRKFKGKPSISHDFRKQQVTTSPSFAIR